MYLPQQNVGSDSDSHHIYMDIDLEDEPSHGRPQLTAAVASALQSALDLVSPRSAAGKQHDPFC